MDANQHRFIEFALENRVLRFGTFMLKSGRESPYFFNSGLFNRGASLARLGRFYADTIAATDLEFDMLYGAAYKGIPLATATAAALAQAHGRDLPWCFDRKEEKDHGEGGGWVGAPVAGRVLMVDDVISAGTSVRTAVPLIAKAGARLVGVLIALDRQERGTGQTSAMHELASRYRLHTVSIISVDHVIEFLAEKTDMRDELARMKDYRARYGARGEETG